MKYLIKEEYYQPEVYQNTRNYLLSSDNPYYFRGDAGEGQGGPHAGLNTIWPMGIILRAMTSEDDEEIVWCIKQLMETHSHTVLCIKLSIKMMLQNFPASGLLGRIPCLGS